MERNIVVDGDVVLFNRQYLESRRKNDEKKVSFIVLSYNNDQFIEECLFSVSKQYFSDYEIIIGDDGSSDGSKDLIYDFIQKCRVPAVAYLHLSNNGIVSNYNSCLCLCAGRYIAHIASDDIVDLNRLNVQYLALCNINASMCVSGLKVISREGKLLRTKQAPKIESLTLEAVLKAGRVTLPSPTMMYSRCLIDDFGLLPSELSNEDEALGIRAQVSGGIISIPNLTVSYRTHGASVSSKARLVGFNQFLTYQLENIPKRIANVKYFESVIALYMPDSEFSKQIQRHYASLYSAIYIISIFKKNTSLSYSALPKTSIFKIFSIGTAMLLKLYIFGFTRAVLDVILRARNSILKRIN